MRRVASGQRHVAHGGRVEGHHHPRLARGQGAHRGGAEAQRDEPVEGGGGAAAQQVSEHDVARFLAGEAAQLRRDARPRATQPVGGAHPALDHRLPAPAGRSALRHHDDGVLLAPPLALADGLRHLLEVVGNLGDEDGVGVGGDAGIERDPAGVAAHHLHDHHPAMRGRGGVQPVDALRGKGNRGVEAEGDHGALEVVVDRLGHSDHAQALLGQGVRDTQRAVPSHRHQGVDALALQGADDLVAPVPLHHRPVRPLLRVLERIAQVRGAEDGAAEVRDAGHVLGPQTDEVPLALRVEEAAVALADPHHLPAVAVRRHHHRPDDGVQPRGVPSPGADRDALQSAPARGRHVSSVRGSSA